MSTQHSAIIDPNIHEPKDISTALNNQVYMADGAGSGDWEYPYFTLEVTVANISSSSSAWVVSPYAATIEKLYSVIYNAISVADNTVTLEIAGTLVTDSSITITQSGSAAGDVDSSTPTAANAVTAGQAIEIVYGGSTTTCPATFTLLMKRTS